jgi:hypothetical protein
MTPIYDAAMPALMAALVLIGMAMGMQTEDE